MTIEFKSPRERRIFKALAVYGPDGGTVSELRRSMKNPPVAGAVTCTLKSLRGRGLAKVVGATADSERTHSRYDGPVDIWAVLVDEGAADASHAAG